MNYRVPSKTANGAAHTYKANVREDPQAFYVNVKLQRSPVEYEHLSTLWHRNLSDMHVTIHF